MPSKGLLRILIVAEVVVVVLIFVSSSIFGPSLPEQLRAYNDRPLGNPFAPRLLLEGVLGILVLIVALVSRIGLFFFWRPARPLYLASGIGNLLMTVLNGPSVNAAWSEMFDGLSAIIYGIILALIYFSSLRDLYAKKKQPNTALEPTPTTP
jgi:energy-coupling factor transporter transmembrane protein EcfT